ncbi:MAG: hypothetical protein L6V84_00480 [Oscillospiraceae bacterium]|nr:MAG: hypothetical protein L6V84_00480 [Oscillospiraceae bacterium]
MNMERLYGEKSYRPNIFEIDFWGTKAEDDREYRDFQRRKIKGNILLAAYYSPVTIQEISIELGVALPFLEDEIKLLVDRQYLALQQWKVSDEHSDFFTLDCTKTIDGKTERTYPGKRTKSLLLSLMSSMLALENRFANANLAHWQKASFYAYILH